MIRITREYPIPESLLDENTAEARGKIQSIIDDKRKPLSKDYARLWGKPDVRDTLWRMQHGKCCYCERKRDATRESDIEHFRPKSEVAENGSHNGYWWLAYKWENLFFSCRLCNQEYKKTLFPLKNEATRAHSPGVGISNEEPMLLNPETDHPEKHLGYDWVGSEERLAIPYGRDADGKGRATICALGLDRSQLNIGRAALITDLKGIVTAMHAGIYMGNDSITARAETLIRRATAPNRRFAGFRREYFRAAGPGDFVATAHE